MSTEKLLTNFPRLSAAYRAYRASKGLRQAPQQTSMGFSFAGNAAMQAGDFEPDETKLVIEQLEQADILVNVGANVGYYCCIALNLRKRVIAFEPLQSNLFHLLRNLDANGWAGEAEVFPLALGQKPGIAKIYGSGTGASLISGWAGQEQYTLVPISSLDLVLGDRLSGNRVFVLVDIEGAELGMLRGATRMLQMEPSPSWLVEISVNEHQPAGQLLNPSLLETFELFAAHGYRARSVDAAARVISLSEVERIVETGVDTLGVHNFLFCRD